MKKSVAFFLFGVIVCLGSGCASTYQIPPLPNQATTSASAGKARIYVLRQTGLAGFTYSTQVFDGDQKIGKIANSRYLCWEREPGKAEIRIDFIAPNVFYGATVRLDCQAGETYYLKHELIIDPVYNQLSCMPANDAKKIIKKISPPKTKL